MTWRQREIWIAITAEKNAYPLGGINPLDPSTTIDDISAELRYFMGRYQSMRTRVHDDGVTRPKQAVSESGEIALEIYEAGELDPHATAAAIEASYRDTDFDYAREWPVRMAVVCQRGTLTHVVVIMHHLATDASGAMAHTTFGWVHKQDMPIDRLYVHIDEAADTIQMTVDIDTEFFSPEDAEALTYATEQAAIEAALDGSASTRV